ncbi:phosphoenolpyruvate--protein phosphotransferase [Brevibacillus borstelensis]|uniref:phosphoenolpyruvate--protein phosphotransferase n=1 Tax=Brevibacillus borstelensis TaxID=45462 RepID=UPI0020420B02|nr:phosphoenolpyruvate--protein phosphotransferase [Brevibacillus borstelensis]MCM3623277.1 phosphoenolpyruvate--protein phosphotransferase [Brevibacillus borstelensis]
MGTIRVHGIGASAGIAIARAQVWKKQDQIIGQEVKSPEEELARFKTASELALSGLATLYEETRLRLGQKEADIFQAHMMLLQDPELIGQIEVLLAAGNINAEAAVQQATGELATLFSSLEDEYMRERAADIRDVGQRLLSCLQEAVWGNLQGTAREEKGTSLDAVIVVAHDLSPSDTAQLDTGLIKGFATQIGGGTSHSAVMARALGIPAVVGLGQALEQVEDGDLIVLDGTAGLLCLRPDEEELSSYEQKRADWLREKKRQARWAELPTVTQDGHRVELGANIGHPDECRAVQQVGGEGIGLFRSEFLFMNRASMPDEEEQFQAYRQVAQDMNGKPVVIRTLDIGGDKELPYMNLQSELNPFLGYRAIRLCLDREELFLTQLRAILRASHYGSVKLMYPMIATLEEWRAANRLLAEAKETLARAGIPFDPAIEVGLMIEVPAAALASELFARDADFLSIGTNDLIQYTLACDRINEQVSGLYQPFHPAILRLIRQVIDAAHRYGRRVSMCGEMASDPLAIPLLLGMGLDGFSMSASSVLAARELINQLSFEEMKELAEAALKLEGQEQVKALLLERTRVQINA